MILNLLFYCRYQIIIDNRRNNRYIHCVFLGHLNDAGQFDLLPRIGPGGPLHLPPDAYLLGDKGCANRYPILTRLRADQIPNQGPDRNAMLIFNS